MELGLDEVGLPVALAQAVFRDNQIHTDDDLLRTCGLERPWVWVKRDPVLHRWGLLWMRARVVPGNAVRLPAAVLGPMGGDCDGDTVAVFRSIPGEEESATPVPPSGMAWDDVLRRPVFMPGRQYLYGLHLLQQDRDRQERLDGDLRAAGAPPWPAGPSAKQALTEWSGHAARHPMTRGEWLSTVERHALLALSQDPGMGLGLVPAKNLKRLGPVQAEAAKQELFAGGGPASETLAAYAGRSLAVFESPPADSTAEPVEDTIATVMAPAAAVKGRFGNVPRRLLYAAGQVDADFVRAVQGLSEQANQRVLSVKAGSRPLNYRKFEKHILKPMLGGREPNYIALPRDLRELLGSSEMQAVCQRIVAGIAPNPPAWTRWLLRPTDLSEQLEKSGGCLELPVDDPRVRPFFGTAGETDRSNPDGAGSMSASPSSPVTA
jgi:hypothetical protein